MDLQNTSIDNIVNELIIADDPNNNENNIFTQSKEKAEYTNFMVFLLFYYY